MEYSNENLYFAAKEANTVASTMLDRAQSFYNFLNANAYLQKLEEMWRAYHGVYGDTQNGGHRVSFTGEQGELVSLPVNHFRNLARHMLTMVTSSRPVMETRAVNTDYKSLAQTYLANGILEYYMREKHLEGSLKKAVEMAIVLGAGFIKLEWNATAGEIYDFDEDSGKFNYEGELEFTNLSPFDVVFDGTKEHWKDHDWIMTRTFQNRFNLMAKYPEYADKIKGLPSKMMGSVYRLGLYSNDDTDDIAVYEFYHKRTEAIPDGRYVLFLDSDLALLDTKMPYRVLPIFRISPSDIMGTPYGYSDMFDIFPIQEAINSLYSSIMTNQNAFAVQNLWVPRGADITTAALIGGMNIVEGNAKPEPLNLTETPPEVFKFLEFLIQSAETVSGISSTTRGNPDASLKSGTALAMVQSTSLEFMSGLQQSYVHLIEDVGTALIQILKDFAVSPKIVALVGKNNRTYLKEFTGEQLSAINRVYVDVGNPLSKTIGGRIGMAEQMLQMKLLKTPEQYFQVLKTGALDVTYEGEMSELLLIKAENERLMNGEQVMTTMLDAHDIHIKEHKAVLADPDLRQDPILVQNTLAHIQQHIEYLRTSDPALLQLIGQQPIPPIPQPMSMEPTQDMENKTAAGNSNMDQMLTPNPGQIKGGDTISGPNIQNVQLPNVPHPPAPFQNSPVTAEQLAMQQANQKQG